MPPFVLFPPEARAAMLRGVDALADALGLTIGPVGRTVAITHISSPHSTPELLPDAGTIARRVIEIPGPFEDMGAMLIRHLACRIQDEVGDGAATAVVIAQAALRESARYIAAGWNATRLREGIEQGLAVALAELQSMARPLETPEAIAGAVEAAVGHPALARVIAEAVDVVGADGAILVEESQGTTIDREYQEGVQWQSGYASARFATDPVREDATLLNSPILLTDYEISSAQELLPVLEKVVAAGERSLAIISKETRDQALALLLVNKERNVLAPLAIKAPFFGEQQRAVLEDIAILTGGRLISATLGRRLEEATLEDLGRARRIWANGGYFNVMGGKGRPLAVRQRIKELRLTIPTLQEDHERDRMRERLGKLQGGTAAIRIGASTPAARSELRRRAESAVKAIQAAMEEGVVPGGGAAYLACIPALRCLALGGAEGAGVAVLMRALEEPARRIVANAGFEPAPTISRLRQQPAGWGYDVLNQRMVDMRAEGIVDALKIARWALSSGVSTAAMALTTDVLVRHRKPEYAKRP